MLQQDSQINSETKQIKRQHQNALLSYTPSPYPGRFTLLKAEEESHSGPVLDRKCIADSRIEIYTIPGNHKTHLEKCSQTAAEQVQAYLDAAKLSG